MAGKDAAAFIDDDRARGAHFTRGLLDEREITLFVTARVAGGQG